MADGCAVFQHQRRHRYPPGLRGEQMESTDIVSEDASQPIISPDGKHDRLCMTQRPRRPLSAKPEMTPHSLRLQLASAAPMEFQGDTAKAKSAYQDFLTLWKDADPEIPILIAAKAEYAKLQ